MLKTALATTALVALLATGLQAQTTTDPAIDPGADPATDSAIMPAPEARVGEAGAVTPDADADAAAPPVLVEDAPADGWTPVDLAGVSTDALIGSDIVNFENEKLASVEDVIITEEGQVESVVARFGGFLGFGTEKVLLTLDEVEVVQDADETMAVRTSLTHDSIATRPAYDG